MFKRLFEPIPIDWLVVYRVVFGAAMFFYAATSLYYGVVTYHYAVSSFRVPYDYFEWIGPLDCSMVIGGAIWEAEHLEYLVISIASIGIAVGLFYRVSAAVFGIVYLHLFLIDKCYFLNHYYLMALLGVMMPFLPAQRSASIDCWLRPEIAATSVPRWTQWLLRMQIGIPYFYGGLAKMNGDWLRGQPMRHALESRVERPWIGQFFTEEWFVEGIVWGGLLFDLSIVPLLLWRRTRVLAFCLCLTFHLTNSFLWTIGIFPWLMMGATTIFFEPDWPRRLAGRFSRSVQEWTAPAAWQAPQGLARGILVTILVTYSSWQLLLPFRHFLLPGDSSWSEYGHYFSWHMLLRAKKTGLRLYARDPQSGRAGLVDLREYVTAKQLAVIGRDPRMIHQLVHVIRDDLERRLGGREVELRVLALVGLNGRKPQLLIDPSVDLAATPLSYRYPEWIVPLREPFRHDAWDYPLEEWEDRLDLRLPDEMRLANAAPKSTVAREID